MAIPLALDLTGLFLAPINRTPRGIDRVELAYARYFLNHWPGECWGILPPPWGVRCFERDRALRLLGAVEELWREGINPQDDAAYIRTKAEILDSTLAHSVPGKPRNLSIGRIAARYFRLLTVAGFSIGRSASRTLPANAIYLNVGQLQVFRPWFWWLKRRPDIVSVFMTHDVTPIEHPARHPPIVVWLHHRIVRHTAEFASALIFPSDAARNSITNELRKYNPDAPLSHVELLPVPDEFLGIVEPEAELASANYFIVCGALDPHKNHIFLLEIWKELIVRLGAHAPKLVIAGTPQLGSDAVFKMLQDDSILRNHVIISPGLATPSLRRVILGAKALLMPSISEGFGLPIVEALAQGTPVIASDIPAHREAGKGGSVVYLSLADKSKWIVNICALSEQSAGSNKLRSLYKPKTWTEYFAGIESFLKRLSER